MIPGNVEPTWSWPRKLLFRFVFVYFVLCIAPFPLGELTTAQSMLQSWLFGTPGDERTFLVEASEWYETVWKYAVVWVGDRVFGLSEPISVMPNGSGDTTFNYVLVFCWATIAAIVALIWSIIDRGSTSYPRLRGALRVYVRFYLASQLIVYGALKVIPTQFPPPSLDRLVQPFGDASPMGLLWTFMGASPAYTIFTGAGELIGGLLLTTRRTTLLGAIVSAAVMTHVVALNFCYDVPVKLFSVQLLAMAVWLIGPDFIRLWNWFIAHRPTDPAPVVPITRSRPLKAVIVVVRTVVVAAFVAFWLYNAVQSRDGRGMAASERPSPLAGVWLVEEFSIDGVTRPPLTTDDERWRRVITDFPGMIAIQLTNGSRVRYLVEAKPDSSTLTLRRRDMSDWKTDFTFHRPDDDHAELSGMIDRHEIRAKLRREDPEQFRASSACSTAGSTGSMSIRSTDNKKQPVTGWR